MHLEFIEECHAGGRLLRLLVAEARVVVDEKGADVGEDEGEDAGVLGRRRNVAPVHEDVLPTTVPVEVSEDEKLALLHEAVDHLLRVVNGRMEHLRWCFPASIQIAAGQRAPVISVDDTVRVQHGDHLEDEVLSENLGLRDVRACQKVKRTFHHP